MCLLGSDALIYTSLHNVVEEIKADVQVYKLPSDVRRVVSYFRHATLAHNKV